MKKSKLFLVGMIAAFVAGSLFMTGCEGPVGPTGPQGPGGDASGIQAIELAAYGYTFGDPTHAVYGQNESYANQIVGTVNINVSPTPVVSSVDIEPVTVAYNNKSVTFWSVVTYTNISDITGAFNTAFTAGELELTASAVNEGTKTYLKIAVTGATGPVAKQISVSAGAAATSLVGKVFNTTGGTVTSGQLTTGQYDTWAYPITNYDATSLPSSAHSKVKVGAIELPVAAGTVLTGLSPDGIPALVADEIGAREFGVVKADIVKAYADWLVTTSPSGDALVFTARTYGPKTFDRVAMRPAIIGADDTTLPKYGYAFLTKHTILGETIVAASAVPTVTAIATANTAAAALATPAAGNYLRAKYDGKQDTVVFPSTGTAASLASVVSGRTLPATGVTFTNTGGTYTFTGPDPNGGDGDYITANPDTTIDTGSNIVALANTHKTLEISGSGAGVFGTDGIITSALSVTDTHGANIVNAATPVDTWTLGVVGANNVRLESTAKGSVVTIGGAATVVPAGTDASTSALQNLFQANLSSTGIANYTVTGGADITIAKTVTGSGATNNLPSVAPTIADL
ncbi:hypothetical protein FACS1894190_12010 [Spirochaetia bacterium]|nr:hypothetical protein FACS1894190_12010 [Spirochaetia bacterium]